MNKLNARVGFVAILFSLSVMSCATPSGGGLRPSPGQFSSQWVDILMGGVMAPPGEDLALMLSLKNKSQQDLDVTASFVTPDPTQRCTESKQIAAGKSAMFSCPQKNLTPNADYPVELGIKTISAKGDRVLVESPKTKFYFSEKDVRGFEEAMKALKR